MGEKEEEDSNGKALECVALSLYRRSIESR